MTIIVENWLREHKDEYAMVLDDDSDIYSIGVTERSDSSFHVATDLIDQGGYYEVHIMAHHSDEQRATEIVEQIKNLLATEEDRDKNIHGHNKVNWTELTVKTTEEKLRSL